MQAKNEISAELRSLSTVIDAISRDTQGAPYTLPRGYFADLPDLVMRKIRSEGSGHNLPEATDPSVGAVTSLLPRREEASPFQVPEGYFEGLAGGIMDRIKKSNSSSSPSVSEELAELSPILSRIERKTPYQVPEGYFDEQAPILAGLQDKPLYQVPEGYFAALPGEIAAKAMQDQATPARIIPMGGRTIWRKISRYSAAAVVAGFILTIGWLRLHTHTPAGNVAKTVDIASGLAKASDQEILNYVDGGDNWSLAEAETNSTTAALDIDESDVNSLLGDVPDGELKQYMEEHGGTKDVATN